MVYYETKVSYTKEVGDGKMAKAKETYLVQALSYADAETRIIDEVSHYSHDGLPEVNIRKVNYIDVFTTDNPNADRWYRVKVVLTILEGDGDNLKEKKVSQFYLVQAWDILSAVKSLEKNFAGNASDYMIHTVQETAILDFYNFGIADVNGAVAAPASEA